MVSSSQVLGFLITTKKVSQDNRCKFSIFLRAQVLVPGGEWRARGGGVGYAMCFCLLQPTGSYATDPLNPTVLLSFF